MTDTNQKKWTLGKIIERVLLILIVIPLACILLGSYIYAFFKAIDYMPWYLAFFGILRTICGLCALYTVMMIIIRLFSANRKELCKKWAKRLAYFIAIYLGCSLIIQIFIWTGIAPKITYSTFTTSKAQNTQEEEKKSIFKKIKVDAALSYMDYYKSDCKIDGKNIYLYVSQENPPAFGYRTIIYYNFFTSDGVNLIRDSNGYQLMTSSEKPEEYPEFYLDIDTVDCDLAKKFIQSKECFFNAVGELLCTPKKEEVQQPQAKSSYDYKYDDSKVGDVVEF